MLNYNYYTAMKHECTKVFLLLAFLILLWGYIKSGMLIKEKLYPEENYDINIFVLAGQSNMAGRGGVKDHVWDKFVPIECRPDPRILRLNAASELEEAEEPLHAGIDVNKTCGIGPGMAFANAVLKKVPNFGTVILVPCAVGGTNIREWSSRDSLLRRRMVERTKDVSCKYGGKIRAILWYQGEKDTETEDGTDRYPGEYETFVRTLYEDLRQDGLGHIPFIQVALASGQGEREWLERVRAAQLAMEDLITVDAMGLPLQPDGLHLSTAAQVRLGNMLADAFLNNINLTL